MANENVDWTLPTPKIAYAIYDLKPWYAVKLLHAFQIPEEDFLSDWYLFLHENVEYILANPKYKKTVSTACVFAYRKLANHYRDLYVRAKRADPARLYSMGQMGSKSAAVTYNTYLLELEEGYLDYDSELDFWS